MAAPAPSEQLDSTVVVTRIVPVAVPAIAAVFIIHKLTTINLTILIIIWLIKLPIFDI
jgi:hypothetical protein